jgi:hypothetical protein
MEYMELMDTLQIQYKDFTKRMKGRVYYDDQETKSLLDGYTEELASFISKELDKAREEGFELGKTYVVQKFNNGDFEFGKPI